METLEQRIMRHEGLTTFPKPDAKDMWVIGYGHDLTEDQAQDYSMGVSQPEAMDMLDSDIAAVKQETIDAGFMWMALLSPVRKDVIYEMCFQLGAEGVLEFTGMIAAIIAKHWQLAHDEMIRSIWDKQTPARCVELANLMLKG